MTKQHFIAAARNIKQMLDSGNIEGARGAAAVFIRTASEFNPRFDAQRFLAACGL